MYGSILYKLLGSFNATSDANPVYTFDSARKNPNNNAASPIFTGLHCPKIITASARNPKPATPFSNFHSLTPAVM